MDVFYLISISCNKNQTLKLAVVSLGVCCPNLLVCLPVGSHLLRFYMSYFDSFTMDTLTRLASSSQTSTCLPPEHYN